jgi:Tol biopolymer transport system component
MPVLATSGLSRRGRCSRPKTTIRAALFCSFLLCSVAAGCGADHDLRDATQELDILSAAEQYDDALQRAKLWQGDAYLSGIVAVPGSEEGFGGYPGLGYSFHSASAPGAFFVANFSADRWSSEVPARNSSVPMPSPIARDDWPVDSVDAWSIALANGGEEFLLSHEDPLTNMGLTLDYWRLNSGRTVLAWDVSYLVLFGSSLHVTIDPKTGDIIEVEERSESGTLVATTPTLPSTPWAPLPACTPVTPEAGRVAGLPERITFESSRDGEMHIYLMEPDGSNIEQVTKGPDSETDAAWSPDGRRIAFTRWRGTELDIYVMDADASNLRGLTDDPGYDREPSWSPDGRRIAFTSNRDGNYNIYVMDADGSNLALLTDHPSEDQSPAWSPDGCRIAFASSRDHWPEAHIYVVDVDGSNVTQLTDGSSLDYEPTWSPDGSRIAFWSQPISETESQANVYVMDQDGSHKVRLTSGPCGGRRPVWSPDGRRIAFSIGRDEPFGSDIFVMDADGSNVVQLTHEPEGNWPSSWR